MTKQRKNQKQPASPVVVVPNQPAGSWELERKPPKRFWANKKTETVLRLLRGEDLELLSRELGVTAAKLTLWRDTFLAAGTESLKRRQSKDNGEIKRLNEKIGEQTMEIELLNEKIHLLEKREPLTTRRSRK